MGLPLSCAHESLARAWVLCRLGLCSEAARAAARLARELPALASCDDDERAVLLAGVVDILRTAGRAAEAAALLAACPPVPTAASSAQQA